MYRCKQNSKEKNGKKTGLIVLVAVLAVALLAGAGYLVYDRFFNDDTKAGQTETENETKEEKDSGKPENAEEGSGDAAEPTQDTPETTAPADETTQALPSVPDTNHAETPTTPPSGGNEETTAPSVPVTPGDADIKDGTATFHGVSMKIPEGFTLSESDESSVSYVSDSGFTTLMLSYQTDEENSWEELMQTNEADITDLMGIGDDGGSVTVKEKKQYQINGHDAVNYAMSATMEEMPVFALSFNMLFIHMDDGVVMIMGGGFGEDDAIDAALGSVSIP